VKFVSYLAFLACLEGLVFSFVAHRMRPASRLTRLLEAAGWLYAWWTGCLTLVYGTNSAAEAMTAYRLSYLGILPVNLVNTWLCLEVAKVKPATQRWVVFVGAAIVVATGVRYLIAGFPWSAVDVTPWGNMGVEAPAGQRSVWGDAVFGGFDLGGLAVVGVSWLRETSRRRRHLIGFTFWAIVATVPISLGVQFVAEAWWSPLLNFVPRGILILLLLSAIERWRLFSDPTPAFSEVLPVALPVPALLLDERDTIVGANPEARRRLAVRGPGLVGERVEQVLDPATLLRSQRSPHYDQFGDAVGSVMIFSQDSQDEDWPANLSIRETEVLSLVVQGLSNQEIADRLFVTKGTVKLHVHHILRRTGCVGREDLVQRWGRIP
jgi:DNA-binding CsgD family transcriptional regulator